MALDPASRATPPRPSGEDDRTLRSWQALTLRLAFDLIGVMFIGMPIGSTAEDVVDWVRMLLHSRSTKPPAWSEQPGAITSAPVTHSEERGNVVGRLERAKAAVRNEAERAQLVERIAQLEGPGEH